MRQRRLGVGKALVAELALGRFVTASERGSADDETTVLLFSFYFIAPRWGDLRPEQSTTTATRNCGRRAYMSRMRILSPGLPDAAPTTC